MLDSELQAVVVAEVRRCVADDRHLLDDVCSEVRILKPQVRRIMERSASAVSIVAADGGNNQVEFDPFLVQIVRVVDSQSNEYYLRAVTPHTDVKKLSDEQYDSQGNPISALGRMLADMGVRYLWEVCSSIEKPDSARPLSPSWILSFRELIEWAVLLSVLRDKEYGSDTIIVFDGLLRSKVFRTSYFAKYRELVDQAIARCRTSHRNMYVVGVAKHSKVLQRYQLALHLEQVLAKDYPCYVEVPYDMEAKSYTWQEYARGDAEAAQGGEANKFVAGKLYLVKFGDSPLDTIWPVDIWQSQTGDAQVVLGHLAMDAREGFPVPYYPRSLQLAHENAAIVDFDLAILQDGIVDAVRAVVADKSEELDSFRLVDRDPASARYR